MNPAGDSTTLQGWRLAQHLWETDSVTIRTDRPFRFASGIESPIYTDCRRLLSFPEARDDVMGLSIPAVQSLVGWDSVDTIAGGETAGIPFAAILADRKQLPLVYVRKQAKDYGKRSRIEGVVEESSRVLLFEDLVSNGESKLSFVRALREVGCEVSHCLVVFEYGLPGCRETLRGEGVELISLLNGRTLVEYGTRKGLLSQVETRAVEGFLRRAE